MLPACLQPVRHPGRGQRGRWRARRSRRRSCPAARTARRCTRAAWPARPRRPAGSRTACRPGRPARPGPAGHDLGPAAERGRRQPAAHDLAVREQVGVDRFAGLRGRPSRRAATRKPVITSSRISSAPCRCAISARNALKPVAGRHHAHVARRGLGDDRGDVGPVGGEGRLDRRAVVVRQHDRLAGRGRGHPGRVGQPERGHARSRPRRAARRRDRGSSRRT